METGENQSLSALRENQALLGPHLPRLLFLPLTLLGSILWYVLIVHIFCQTNGQRFTRPGVWGTISVTVK